MPRETGAEDMKILGLTGSIGMGKSTTAEMFRAEGVPVYDADASVHALYANGGAAVGPVEEAFPGVTKSGAIDRQTLKERVLGDDTAMKQLEAIVHPLTAKAQVAFKQEAEASGAAFVVLDIPLLFETGGDKRCDHIAVVTAPLAVQRERVLSRPDMTEQAFQSILSRQTPDADKRASADFIINTSFGLDFARAHVRAITGLLNQARNGNT